MPLLAARLDGVQGGVRFFLENVREALAPGSFFVDQQLGHIYLWRREDWAPAATFAAVVPAAFEAIHINGSSGVSFRNLRFADTSWRTWGGNGEEDGPGSGPNDATIRVNQALDVQVEQCEFGPSLSGYASAAVPLRLLSKPQRSDCTGCGDWERVATRECLHEHDLRGGPRRRAVLRHGSQHPSGQRCGKEHHAQLGSGAEARRRCNDEASVGHLRRPQLHLRVAAVRH